MDAANNALKLSCVLSARRILELAQNAYSLYLSGTHAERGQLLKTVLSNCVTDGVNHCPTYKKPFDIIFERAKNEEWRRERDSNPRYGFPYSGFQDHPFQPLTHPSASKRVWLVYTGWRGSPAAPVRQFGRVELGMHARSLGPLVRTRAFGRTPSVFWPES